MKPFSISLTFLAITLSAQELHFDFETNDLTGWYGISSGHWEISNADPLGGSYSLHHGFDSDESAESNIFLLHNPLEMNDKVAKWSFLIRHGYAPSGSNHWAVLLGEDRSFSKAYIVGVNYRGSNDLLKLWQVKEGEVIELAASEFNWQEEVGTGYAARVTIEHNPDHGWSLYISLPEGEQQEIISNLPIEATNPIRLFGIHYAFTSSQDRKFWFDDLMISGDFREDNTLPAVDQLLVESGNQLKLIFTEPIDTSKSLTISSSIGGDIELLEWINDEILTIIFEHSFGLSNTLSIQGLTDYYNNQASIITEEFTYYQALPYDILITEIMADPDPPNQLPNAEYLEVFNTTEYDIMLNGWVLKVNSTVYTIPTFLLRAGCYAILTDDDLIEDFQFFGDVIGCSGLPSLINGGANLELRDNQGGLIHFLCYSSDWYKTEFKSEGGWSLEMIDSENPCQGESNWQETDSNQGGTPGQPNSVKAENPDLEDPELLRVAVESDTVISLYFSETLDSAVCSDASIYLIDEIGNPKCTFLQSPGYTTINLTVNVPLHEEEVYHLLVQSDIADCSGNTLDNSVEIYFGLPVNPDPGQLVINEIMYEPEFGSEYVELYNNSGNIVELQNCYMAIRDEQGEIGKESLICSGKWQMMPDEYLVLTQSAEFLKTAHALVDESKVIEMGTWPSLINEGGELLLLNSEDVIIDQAIWAPDMHFELLDNTRGVSLERISPSGPGMEFYNWHSASGNEDYATPGYVNSQFKSELQQTNTIEITPDKISPDNDGIDDLVSVCYHFNQPGHTGSLKVFDPSGRIVKTIVDVETLETTGCIYWDGLNDSGLKLQTGFYIIVFESFGSDGSEAKQKKAIVIGE